MKTSLQHRKEMHEDAPVPLDFKGEIEIEYNTFVAMPWPWKGSIPMDIKATISYRIWSIDTESAACEYSFIGSVNYLPSDVEQLILDYLQDLPEMKGATIYQIKLLESIK